jgi:hypothetical protein
MQTKPKANSIITHLLDVLLGRPIITFKFRGEDIGRLDTSKMSAECKERAMIHGLVQRIGDGGAVERQDKATGLIRTDAEMDDIKKARIMALIEHYNSGTTEWNLTRSSTGGGVDTSGLTIEAISRVYNWTVADTERKVDTLAEKKGIERKEMLRTYANIPDVASMIGTIKAERAARTGLDAVSMADELANA